MLKNPFKKLDIEPNKLKEYIDIFDLYYKAINQLINIIKFTELQIFSQLTHSKNIDNNFFKYYNGNLIELINKLESLQKSIYRRDNFKDKEDFDKINSFININKVSDETISEIEQALIILNQIKKSNDSILLDNELFNKNKIMDSINVIINIIIKLHDYFIKFYLPKYKNLISELENVYSKRLLKDEKDFIKGINKIYGRKVY